MHKRRKNKMRREAGLLKGFTTYKTHTSQCSYIQTRIEFLVSSRQSNISRVYRTVWKYFLFWNVVAWGPVHMLLYIIEMHIILLSLEFGIFGGLIFPVCSYILSESRLCHSILVCLCPVLHNGWICSQGSHKIKGSACSTLTAPATALSIHVYRWCWHTVYFLYIHHANSGDIVLL